MSMAKYQSYTDVLDKGKQNQIMDHRDKQKLIKRIDKLETKDHIGILKIIMEATDRKIYTVNNYGTYFDLNDLDNNTVWKISYHVSLCLENLKREKDKKEAERKYQEDRNTLEDQLRSKSKLKLTTNNLNLSITRRKNHKDTSTDTSNQDSDDDQSSDLKMENHIGINSDLGSELTDTNFSLNQDDEDSEDEISE